MCGHLAVTLLVTWTVVVTSVTAVGREPRDISGSNWDNAYYSNIRHSLDNNTVVNKTVTLGDTAFLPCKVRNLGERTISWIRRSDFHVLTAGLITYTKDARFRILHQEGSDDWTLQLKYVQARDNGTYECQVSHGTGIISKFVNLEVVVPEAFILGNGEYHIEVGSTISLVCIIEKSPTPPQYVMWYHNQRMINYDTVRGDISVETELGEKSRKTTSRLTIKEARVTDTGNYTCQATNIQPATIRVYVTEGALTLRDKTAAIQRRKTSSASEVSSVSLLVWSLVVTTLRVFR